MAQIVITTGSEEDALKPVNTVKVEIWSDSRRRKDAVIDNLEFIKAETLIHEKLAANYRYACVTSNVDPNLVMYYFAAVDRNGDKHIGADITMQGAMNIGNEIANKVPKHKLIHERVNELAEQYRWKAENIVRFLEKLEWKSTKDKEDFVAKELANAYILGVRNRMGGIE